MPTPPPSSEENASSLYGIRTPKANSHAYLLGTLLGHTADDIETVLTDFGLPTVATGTPIVAASSAARDAHWGVPSSAAARRALQDLGAITVRTDLGITEQYFAGLTDGGANPGGRSLAGWYALTSSAVLSRSTDFSLTTSVQAVPFTTAPVLRGLSWVASPNPTRIIANTPGRYLVSGRWQLNTTGSAEVYLRKNGAGLLNNTQTAASVAGAAVFDYLQAVTLAAGDYIEVMARITAGPYPWMAANEVSVELLASR